MQSCPANAKQIIWNVDPEKPAVNIINAAAALIKSGGVVVYPTETFYAIGGLPVLAETIKRIAEIKGRGPSKPFPLIAASEHDVLMAIATWPPAAKKLASIFWPGPLTMILPASSRLPEELHLGTGKIAIRVSSHPIASFLARTAGGLLISTSANISGQAAISDPGQIDPIIMSAIDILLAGGQVPGLMPSTIVDVSESKVRLIRRGSLPWAELKVHLLDST